LTEFEFVSSINQFHTNFTGEIAMSMRTRYQVKSTYPDYAEKKETSIAIQYPHPASVGKATRKSVML
jgi:hypothetical protein